MPAVTADTLTLPRLPEPAPGAHERPVARVTTAPSGFEGEGFPVRRAFAGVPLEELDPFVHMDQMGAIDYGPGEPKGTPWHPHRGFETVTYIIDGTLQHQDSHGGGGVITDGATQWMTAGGGILHIETPPEKLVVPRGRARRTRRSRSSMPRSLPARASNCPGARTSTLSCMCSPAPAGWVPTAAPFPAASWSCSAPVTICRSPRTSTRRRPTRPSRPSSPPADRPVSPRPATAPAPCVPKPRLRRAPS